MSTRFLHFVPSASFSSLLSPLGGRRRPPYHSLRTAAVCCDAGRVSFLPIQPGGSLAGNDSSDASCTISNSSFGPAAVSSPAILGHSFLKAIVCSFPNLSYANIVPLSGRLFASVVLALLG